MTAIRRFRKAVSAFVRSSLGVMAACACGSVVSGDKSVDDLVGGLCHEHNAACVPSSVKDDLGFDEYLSDFYWGRFSRGIGEIELPGDDIRPGIICIDDARCAEDLTTCGFVVLHEIGHQKVGSDQTDADCWAVTHATPEQIAAGIALVCSFDDPPRCAAIKACAP